MTRNEAYNLLLALPRFEVYVSQDVIKHNKIPATINEIDNFDYDELLEYFESLSLPYDFVLKFITDELEGYASLNNENFGDDYDYLELWRGKDGKLDLGVWTEVCGNMYFLSNYGKTWKEYVLSEEEIKEREAHYEKWNTQMKDIFKNTFDHILPKFVEDIEPNCVAVKKICSDGLGDYKNKEDK